MLEKRLGAKSPPNRPALRLVSPTPPLPQSSDPVTRESHLRMIRHLRNRYGMQILVDQATFARGSLEQLEDGELAQLHVDMFRAFECLRDGVSWEDAGLIRETCGRHG